MVLRSEWWPDLRYLAEDQGGLITAAQGRLAGATRAQLADLIEKGTLTRQQHGVYQLTGTPVDQWTDLRAAWLTFSPQRTAAQRLRAEDPDGIVSHRSAALLLGLGALDADHYEFTCSKPRRTRNPHVLIHVGHLHRTEWTVEQGLPVTTPAVTVRMLAGQNTDYEHLARIARDAMWRHDVPAATLADTLDPFAPAYGFTSGGQMLDHQLTVAGIPASSIDLAAAAATSALREKIAHSTEVDDLTRLLTEKLRQHLTPALHQALSTPTGQHQHLDLAYMDQRTALHIESLPASDSLEQATGGDASEQIRDLLASHSAELLEPAIRDMLTDLATAERP